MTPMTPHSERSDPAASCPTLHAPVVPPDPAASPFSTRSQQKLTLPKSPAGTGAAGESEPLTIDRSRTQVFLLQGHGVTRACQAGLDTIHTARFHVRNFFLHPPKEDKHSLLPAPIQDVGVGFSSYGRRPNLPLTSVVLVRCRNKITKNTASFCNSYEFWAKGWNIFSSLFYHCLE